MVTAAKPPELSATTAAPPCRVCGHALSLQHDHCPQCGIPTRSRLPNPLDITAADIVFATFTAITTLAISLPITLWLGRYLWQGPFVGGNIEAAFAISTINGWMIGVPVWVTVWRWRDRVREDDHHHGIAVRDYWQTQALCLIPPGMIIIPMLTFYVWMNFF